MSEHNYTTSKLCKDCKESKPISCFSPNKYSKDRLNYICKSCSTIRTRSYVAANKEAVSERKKAYRSKPENKAKQAIAFTVYKNKNEEQLRKKRIEKYAAMTPEERDKKRVSNRSYWARNRDEISKRRNSKILTPEEHEQNKLRSRKWYITNKEKVLKKSAEYYKENRERVITNVRKYERANPEKVRLLGRVKAHRRRIRLDAAGGDNYTRQDVERIYKLQRGCCASCRKKLEGKYHIDHRIPVAKGGNNTAGNIELLCPPCNLKKSDKLPHQFAQENGRLI